MCRGGNLGREHLKVGSKVMLSALFQSKPSPAAAAIRVREKRPERGTEGFVRMDQQRLVLESWGYTGFLARDYEGSRRAGEEVEIDCALAFNGKPLKFTCKAKLVRVDNESRKLVGAFIDMAPTARTKMAQVLGG